MQIEDNTNIKTLPNSSKISTIKYTPTFSAICSVGKAPFNGEIEIIYTPKNSLLEFESFEDWLKSLSLSQITIEELNRIVFDKLTEVLGEIPLTVNIHAKTTVHAPVTSSIIRHDI